MKLDLIIQTDIHDPRARIAIISEIDKEADGQLLTLLLRIATPSPRFPFYAAEVLARIFHFVALEEPPCSGEQNLGHRKADRENNSNCLSRRPLRGVRGAIRKRREHQVEDRDLSNVGTAFLGLRDAGVTLFLRRVATAATKLVAQLARGCTTTLPEVVFDLLSRVHVEFQ